MKKEGHVNDKKIDLVSSNSSENKINNINNDNEFTNSNWTEDGFNEGTIIHLYRETSLIGSTKERCHKLFNQYMK